MNKERILPQSDSDGVAPGVLMIENRATGSDIRLRNSRDNASATSARSISPLRTSLVSIAIPFLSPWSSFRSLARSKLVNGSPTRRPGLITIQVAFKRCARSIRIFSDSIFASKTPNEFSILNGGYDNEKMMS